MSNHSASTNNSKRPRKPSLGRASSGSSDKTEVKDDKPKRAKTTTLLDVHEAKPIHIDPKHIEQFSDLYVKLAHSFKQDNTIGSTHPLARAYRTVACHDTVQAMIASGISVKPAPGVEDKTLWLGGIFSDSTRETMDSRAPSKDTTWYTSLRWQRGPPGFNIAGDVARTVPIDEDCDYSLVSSAIMVDVYWCGHEPMNQQALHKIFFSKNKTGVVHVITRIFVGEAGGDETGQCWVRNAQNLIQASNCAEEHWPPHPDATHWLDQYVRVGDDLVTTTFSKVFGPYRVFKVDCRPAAPDMIVPEVRGSRLVVPKITYQEIEFANRWYNWERWLIPTGVQSVLGFRFGMAAPRKVRVLVHTGIATALQHYANMPAHGTNQDSAFARVQTELGKLPEGPLLRDRHPDVYARIIEGTTAYVSYSARARRANDATLLRAGMAAAEADQEVVRARHMPPQWTSRRRKLLFIMSIVVAAATVLSCGAAIVDAIGPMIFRATPPPSPAATPTPTQQPFFMDVRKVVQRPSLFKPGVLEAQFRAHPQADAGHLHLWRILMATYALSIVFFVFFRFKRAKRVLVAPIRRMLEAAYGSGRGNDDVVFVTPVDSGLPGIGNQVIADANEIAEEGLTVSVRGEKVALEDLQRTLPVDPTPVEAYEAGVRDGFYPLMHFIPSLGAVANTDRNLLNALIVRTFAGPLPFEGRSLREGVTRESLWTHTARNAVQSGFFHRIDYVKTALEEGLRLEGGKRAAWMEACANICREGIMAVKTKRGETVKVFLKSNETLPLKEVDVDGTMMVQVKGRTVNTLTPEAHTLTVPASSALTACIKDMWDGETLHHFDDGEVSFNMVPYYCSSLKPAELDALADKMMVVDTHAHVVAVAGDDCLARLCLRGQAVWVTSDFSRFDSTQNEEALVKAADHWMAACEFPDEVRTIFKCAYTSSFSFKGKKGGDVTGTGKLPFIFPSGLGITSVGNGVTNVLAWTYVIRCIELDPPAMEDLSDFIRERMAELGFLAKIHVQDDVEGIDFLRGWFLPTSEGSFSWQPLPSRIFKLGKISSNPQTITKVRGEAKLSHREACRVVAGAYVDSHANIPRNTPFVGPLLDAYARVRKEGKKIHRQQLIERAEYSVTQGMARTILDSTFQRNMEKRYSIAWTDVLSFKELLQREEILERFPCVVNFPPLQLLMDVDY